MDRLDEILRWSRRLHGVLATVAVACYLWMLVICSALTVDLPWLRKDGEAVLRTGLLLGLLLVVSFWPDIAAPTAPAEETAGGAGEAENAPGNAAQEPASPTTEYAELGANMKHYASMRFAQLTIFVAATGSLLGALHWTHETSDFVTVLKAAGVLVAIAFWVMEERAATFYHHYLRRAQKLDGDFGYQTYKPYPRAKLCGLVTATNAARLMFLAVSLFWVYALNSDVLTGWIGTK